MTTFGAFHIILHVLLPLLVAFVFYRERWQRAWVVMLLTMVVDLDHLIADPIYDPGRCSIGFHPLHTALAITVYAVLLFPRATRLPAIGLVIHMVLDGLDCVI